MRSTMCWICDWPKDILMSAWQASAPHHGPCRDNKVGREEMLGMLALCKHGQQGITNKNGKHGYPGWI